MKGSPSEYIVEFYFSLDEKQKWAVRHAFRGIEQQELSDDLQYIENHFRGKHELLLLSEKLGIDIMDKELLKSEERYAHLIRYNVSENKVETIHPRERITVSL